LWDNFLKAVDFLSAAVYDILKQKKAPHLILPRREELAVPMYFTALAASGAGLHVPKIKIERKSNVKTRIRALLLALVLVLTMTTGAWAAGTGSERTAEARLTMTAEYRAGNAVVTVYLEGGEGVTNGRLTATYDPKVSTLTGSRVLGGFGASSVNGETAGEVCLAWVGSNLTAEKTPMVELTFQVTQDGTFTAEASEVYAGEEKRTVEGDAVSLAYNPFQDIENHWAKEEILKAYHEGLFQGVTETKFIPEGKMDRAMFVTVLYRLAGSPAVESLETAFTDVDTAQYYGAAVAWAVEHGVTNGVSQTQFAPHQAISRQELVTMLYRYAGSPAVTGQTHFTDVGEDRYYSQAVAWAEEVQVANGYPDGTFRPNQDISREQLVTMLFRYVRSQEADNGLRDSLSDFDDGDKISKFARESMQWAVANQVINGVTATTLAPKAQATRAQTATVLYRTLASL